MAKEILTLQVGNYSNFVGTNWWNLQETAFHSDKSNPAEVCYGVTFREGLTPKGEQTYLPRVVCFDLESNFEGKGASKDLYQDSPTEIKPIKWDESKVVYGFDLIKEEDEPTNEKNIDYSEIAKKKLRLWSDDALTPLHPRSLYAFKDNIYNSEGSCLGSYRDGFQIASSVNEMDEIESRIRYFCEECDHLQGFQLLVDANGGFGGVAACIASYLEDEFNNKPILGVPLFDLPKENDSQPNDMLLGLNSFLCMEKLLSSCRMTLPVSCYSSILPTKPNYRNFPFLKFDETTPSYSAPILAAALDTATMIYRLNNDRVEYYDCISQLNYGGRRAAVLSTLLPFPTYEYGALYPTIFGLELDMQLQTLTPSCNVIGSNDLIRLATLRGFNPKIKVSPQQVRHFRPGERFVEFEDILHWYLQQMCSSKASLLRLANTRLQFDSMSAQIFGNCIKSDGCISKKRTRSADDDVTIPMLSVFHSNSSLNTFFEDLLFLVNKPKAKKFRCQSLKYVEEDDFIALIENVKQFASCYS